MTRALLLLPMLVLSAPLAAQSTDSAAFIIRLGTDTTAVERYVRTADHSFRRRRARGACHLRIAAA